MATTAPSEHKRVPLTQFHNATGNFLDQAMREPIVLTSHGRPRQIVADHANVARLEEMVIEGVKTTIPLHQKLLGQADILNGDYSIKWLEEWLARRAG